MIKLLHRALRAFRDGRVIFIILTYISTKMMRNGNFTASLWFAKCGYSFIKNNSLITEIRRCESIADWTKRHACTLISIYPERLLELCPINLVGYQYQKKSIHSLKHDIVLPPISINFLKKVQVVGGSEMIFTYEGAVLYDEIALGNVDRYGVKVPEILLHDYFPPFLPAATDDYVQCTFKPVSSSDKFSSAISLLKDHSHNYYHWLLECLPRAILSLNRPELSDHPFLIDEGLPAQLTQSLRLLAPTRKFIEIPRSVRVYVEELFFPSVLSPTHDYFGKSPRADDFLIAPEAVMLLRKQFLPHALTSDGQSDLDYIYVARSGASHRTVTNEDDVINLVENMGFNVVYPGKLSFVEQITLFSNAKIIIGPTGAGMANIIFAKEECKIAVLAASTNNANHYLFAQLSQHVGQMITYVCGKPVAPNQFHSDYQIDVNVLQNLIIRYFDAINIENTNAIFYKNTLMQKHVKDND